MHALIVVSHPLQDSLTQSIAKVIAQEIVESDEQHSVEIADLTREGFNPTFSAADVAAFMKTASIPRDVVKEQVRIDKSDALVLVFPIYWWSMPAILKGWIDRVFSNGWGYEESDDGKVIKKLAHLPIHIVGIGGAGKKTYENRGFMNAYNTQISHGIFDYCGAPVATNATLMMPDLGTPEACLKQAKDIGRGIFGS